MVCYGSWAYADDSYQLLRSDPTGYAEVKPNREWRFPEDHQPHEEFRIEWWYLTANLNDEAGNQYGIHWTLFRQAMDSEANPGGWSSNQIWMAHGAISTPTEHVYKERFARGGIGQAGVELNPEGKFEAWLDDWTWRGNSASPFPGTLDFEVDDYKVSLALNASTPWVLQGKSGFSQKSSMGQASYYYSQPHIDISAELTRDNVPIKLTGKGWLDREWSSQPLAPDQTGWDWLSIHLDDGHALMIFRLRQTNGDDWFSGSWINPDGVSETLGADDIRFEEIKRSSVSVSEGQSREMPLHWRIELPAKNLAWEVAPLSAEHWLNTAFPYWEGPVEVTGSTTGKGFLELTGY
ncbi:MAG: putative secreted hydrolase [Candidatus Azotimanducaceae bacterium]|jgi:predicted secreted hydrolase